MGTHWLGEDSLTPLDCTMKRPARLPACPSARPPTLQHLIQQEQIRQ